jgi:hypothetical protein
MRLINEQIFSVSRPPNGETPGNYVDGVLVPGTSTNVRIKGAVQPLPGKDVKQLAPGDRLSHGLVLLSRTLVKVNDIVTIDGEPFQVQQVKDRTRQTSLKHYRCLMMKVDT